MHIYMRDKDSIYVIIQLFSDTYIIVYAITIMKIKRIQDCDYMEKVGRRCI